MNDHDLKMAKLMAGMLLASAALGYALGWLLFHG